MSRTIDDRSERFGVHADPPPSLAAQAARILRPLASLKLTVVLFSLSIALVFFGSLAQKNFGNETVVQTYFRSWHIVWIPLKIFVPSSYEVSGSFPFPGGWLLGGALLANLLTAHALRFRFAWRRCGIIILHAGLVLLMVNEFATGMFQVEGQMAIHQGSSANYAFSVRSVELAIIDKSNPKTDDVVVIPMNVLRSGARIENPLLPADVVVNRYMVNSVLVRRAAGEATAATAGDGLTVVPREQPEVSGTARKQKADTASAYVTFKKKGSDSSLGTYLVSVILPDGDSPAPQTIRIDGKEYVIALRFKRMYKPYTLHLIHFEVERYRESGQPKGYSSLVQLVDPSRHEDREVKIYMNHPLRYAGETIYQQSFDEKTEAMSVLQVVDNPSWRLPYIACAVVAFGMVLHFGQNLTRFLNRRVSLGSTARFGGLKTASPVISSEQLPRRSTP